MDRSEKNTFFSAGLMRVGFISILVITFISCEHSLEPIKDRGKQYSIYGTLTIQGNDNYIRVHDTRDLLNADDTRDLKVNLTFTDLQTGDTELLSKLRVQFDSIYTHNYKVESAFDYDHRYKIELEDEEGFRDSIISVSPEYTTAEMVSDIPDDCNDEFVIELDNMKFEAGEKLNFQYGFKYNDKWHWLSETAPKMEGRYSISSPTEFFFDERNQRVRLEITPWAIMQAVFYRDDQHATDWRCSDFESQIIRFRYSHVGYMETDTFPEGESRIPAPTKAVLIHYEEEVAFDIGRRIFVE